MQEELLDDNILVEEEKPPKRLYPRATERLAAFVVDIWLLGMVLLFFFFIGVYWNWSSNFIFPFLLLIPLYKWGMEGQFGGTVGKNLLQIRIVQLQDQAPINHWTAFKRNSFLWLFCIVLMVILYLEASVPIVYDFEFTEPSLTSRIGQWLGYGLTVVGVTYCSAQVPLAFDQPPRSVLDKWAGTVGVLAAEKEE